MALTTFPGSFTVPSRPISVGIVAAVNYLLDAAGEQVAAGIFASPGGNIRTVAFSVATVTSAPTGLHEARLETVDPATGLATGTLAGTTTNGTILLNTTGWKTVTLTADCSVATGTKLALIIKAPASNFGSIRIGTNGDIPSAFPYVQTVGGGKGLFIPQMAVILDTGVVPFTGCLPYQAFTSNSYNSGTNPNRRGLRFRLPCAARLAGIDLWVDADADFDVVFYAADGVTATVLASVDKDVRAGTTPDVYRIDFTSPQSLVANTYYRVVVLPTSGSNVAVTEAQVATAAYWNAVEGGQDFHWTQVNGVPAAEGDWTNTTTSRLYASLRFDQIDVTAAGGGGTSRSRVQRGM